MLHPITFLSWKALLYRWSMLYCLQQNLVQIHSERIVMNIVEMANYITNIFPENKQYYKEHIGDYGTVLAHVFAIETINIPMEKDFKLDSESEIFRKYCTLIQYLWENGDDEVRNVIDVTILESISDHEQMWKSFGRHISQEFIDYINDEVLTKNILMSGIHPFGENELNRKINVLFNRYWDEELSEEDLYQLEEAAEKLIKTHRWSGVYRAASDYLHTNCKTPEAVINFAHLYWVYEWHKHPIPNPYEFLGYFYARIDMNTEKYDEMDILDSLTLEILPRSGHQEVNLYDCPQYLPETDPLLLKAVEAHRKQMIK